MPLAFVLKYGIRNTAAEHVIAVLIVEDETSNGLKVYGCQSGIAQTNSAKLGSGSLKSDTEVFCEIIFFRLN